MNTPSEFIILLFMWLAWTLALYHGDNRGTYDNNFHVFYVFLGFIITLSCVILSLLGSSFLYWLTNV